MGSKAIKQITLSGVPVPFDGVPRLAEIEAYDAALKEGGTTQALVRHMVPAAINTRAKPEKEWAWKASDAFDEGTILGVLDVVLCVQAALSSPKVKARIEELTLMIENRAKPTGKASDSGSATTTTRTLTK